MYSRIKVTFSLLLYQQSFYTVSSTTYVKMYIYIYVNTHIYIYTNTNTYTYTYTYTPHPAKRRLCPTPPRENYQNLWGAAGQSWFQSIVIRKVITRKDPILSDKYLPHSQISWFTHFLGPTAPRPVNFSLAPPHPIAILWQNYSSSFQNSLMYRYFF